MDTVTVNVQFLGAAPIITWSQALDPTALQTLGSNDFRFLHWRRRAIDPLYETGGIAPASIFAMNFYTGLATLLSNFFAPEHTMA
jgi:hypothetical protein